MRKKELRFTVDVYSSIEELSTADACLLTAARAATQHAYAPYSRFLVGAAASLQNGKIVTGTNQENASYPVGLCAERVLLSAVASQEQGVAINTIAVSYNNLQGESNRPVSPCGICRQSLAEFEDRFGHPIRIILSGMTGEVHIVETVKHLLPLSFGSADMK